MLPLHRHHHERLQKSRQAWRGVFGVPRPLQPPIVPVPQTQRRQACRRAVRIRRARLPTDPRTPPRHRLPLHCARGSSTCRAHVGAANTAGVPGPACDGRIESLTSHRRCVSGVPVARPRGHRRARGDVPPRVHAPQVRHPAALAGAAEAARPALPRAHLASTRRRCLVGGEGGNCRRSRPGTSPS